MTAGYTCTAQLSALLRGQKQDSTGLQYALGASPQHG